MPLTHECFVPILIEIGPVVLEKKSIDTQNDTQTGDRWSEVNNFEIYKKACLYRDKGNRTKSMRFFRSLETPLPFSLPSTKTM